MTQVPSAVLQALTEILTAQSPQFAARLKPRLTAALQAKEEPPFDERKLGFKGFRDFLERGTQGLFSVEPCAPDSDVLVSLIGSSGAHSHQIQASNSSGHSFRNDVWQAFTNPDSRRARFWGILTNHVRHYLQDEDSLHAREVQGSPNSYVEIDFVPADTQVSWMREFIKQHAIPEERLAAIEGILSMPYSTGSNAAFASALGGALTHQWRQQRIKNVTSVIHEWADSHSIPRNHLYIHASSEEEASLTAIAPEKPARTEHVGAGGVQDPRERAVRLLDLLSNDEISRIVVPILLSTLLVKEKN